MVVRLFGSPRIGPAVPTDTEELPGLKYMYWSVLQQKRDAIQAGERFRLRLHLRPYPFAPVGWRDGCSGWPRASTWPQPRCGCCIRLGGVRRVGPPRRPGGIRAVAEPEGWPEALPPLVSKATTTAELAGELGEGIRRIRLAAGWNSASRRRPVVLRYPARASLPALPDRHHLSIVVGGRQLGRRAVPGVPHRTQAGRHRQVAALLLQGRMTVRTIQRAILGLPITFFFKSIFADLTGRGVDPREARRKSSATVSPARGLGRTSPLFFRVVPLAGDPASFRRAHGVFRSRFLPDHEMTVKPNDFSFRPARVDAPTDFSLIDRWFDHVRKQQVDLLPVALR